MLTIIAGSRMAREQDVLYALQKCPWTDQITKVISGTAVGSDRFGEMWAMRNGVEVLRMPAEWNIYGLGAGPRRNNEMAQNADSLIAVWDGISAGTRSMITCARRYGLKTMIYYYLEQRIENNSFLSEPEQYSFFGYAT